MRKFPKGRGIPSPPDEGRNNVQPPSRERIRNIDNGMTPLRLHYLHADQSNQGGFRPPWSNDVVIIRELSSATSDAF